VPSLAGKRAAASSALAVPGAGKLPAPHFPVSQAPGRRLARCLSLGVLAFVPLKTPASGAADSQALGGHTPDMLLTTRKTLSYGFIKGKDDTDRKCSLPITSSCVLILALIVSISIMFLAGMYS
jgi:hypothetical protein